MSLRRSVNNFSFIVLNSVKFRAKKSICEEFYYTILFKKNLQLKYTEFLLRRMAIILRRKHHAAIGLDASKIMIIIVDDKECSGAPKKFEDEEALLRRFMSDAS